MAEDISMFGALGASIFQGIGQANKAEAIAQGKTADAVANRARLLEQRAYDEAADAEKLAIETATNKVVINYRKEAARIQDSVARGETKSSVGQSRIRDITLQYASQFPQYYDDINAAQKQVFGVSGLGAVQSEAQKLEEANIQLTTNAVKEGYAPQNGTQEELAIGRAMYLKDKQLENNVARLNNENNLGQEERRKYVYGKAETQSSKYINMGEDIRLDPTLSDTEKGMLIDKLIVETQGQFANSVGIATQGLENEFINNAIAPTVTYLKSLKSSIGSETTEAVTKLENQKKMTLLYNQNQLLQGQPYQNSVASFAALNQILGDTTMAKVVAAERLSLDIFAKSTTRDDLETNVEGKQVSQLTQEEQVQALINSNLRFKSEGVASIDGGSIPTVGSNPPDLMSAETEETGAAVTASFNDVLKQHRSGNYANEEEKAALEKVATSAFISKVQSFNLHGKAFTPNKKKYMEFFNFLSNENSRYFVEAGGQIPLTMREEFTEALGSYYTDDLTANLTRDSLRDVTDYQGSTKGQTTSKTYKTYELAQPVHNNGNVTFVAVEGSGASDKTVRNVVAQLNKSYSKALSNVVKSSAHMDGVVDYNKYYDETIGESLYSSAAFAPEIELKSKSDDEVKTYINGIINGSGSDQEKLDQLTGLGIATEVATKIMGLR